jgi:2-polyprenyl-3-methyl-5-hydroxy-6-metoxy-1,4-benzoquinol methylase
LGERPPRSELGLHYPSDYAPYQADEQLFLRVFFRLLNLAFVHSPESYYGLPVPAPPRPGLRALDVGAGAGLLSRRLKKVGWEVTSLDFSAHSLARLRRLGTHVVQGDGSALPFRAGTFHLVIASQVLEHFYDPAAALRGFRRVVAPDGLVEIAVPNLDSGARKIFGEMVCMGLSLPRHLTHFTPRSLNRAMVDAGFSAPEIRTVPSLSFGGSIAQEIGVLGNVVSRRQPFLLMMGAGFPVDMLCALRGSGGVLTAVSRPG